MNIFQFICFRLRCVEYTKNDADRRENVFDLIDLYSSQRSDGFVGFEKKIQSRYDNAQCIISHSSI